MDARMVFTFFVPSSFSPTQPCSLHVATYNMHTFFVIMISFSSLQSLTSLKTLLRT